MYCTSGGRGNMTFRFQFARYLRNLASTECRILSSVCPRFPLPEAYCSDLWDPWRCGRKGWCNAKHLINITRHARWYRSYMTSKTGHITYRKRDYLWAQTKVTSKEKVKIPKCFFLILPIATVFEAVSGCEWGERTSNLLQTAQRSQWEAHAWSQPKIKEWRLMMVDEQFPLQRKILKGQVVVWNEEASICARREMNDSSVHFRIVLFLCASLGRWVSWQGQTMGCTEGLKWSKCQFRIKFISAPFMLLDIVNGWKEYNTPPISGWHVTCVLWPYENICAQQSCSIRTKIENECHQHPWVLHPTLPCNVFRGPAVDQKMQKEHQSARAERWDGKHNPTIHFPRFEYIFEAAGRDASLL